jgi:hypothetical protein
MEHPVKNQDLSANSTIDSGFSEFESLMNSDPADFSFRLLNSVIPELANQQKLEVEYKLEMLKTRFSLSSDQVRALRSDINSHRKDIKYSTGQPIDSIIPENKTYSMNFPGLIDVVEKDNEPHFMIKKGEEILCVKEYEIDGTIMILPAKDKIPFPLVNYETVMACYNAYFYFSESEINWLLFNEINLQLQQVSTLPSKSDYLINTLWIFHTYLLEKFNYSPIICFAGVPERGKSRTRKGMIYSAFRGIVVETVREAHIIRLADYFNASIFFDTMDLWKKVSRTGSEDIFLLRFEKGAIVGRIHSPEKGKFQDTTYYNIFGSTIIATNEDMHKILDTRSINISLPYTSTTFEEDIRPEMFLQFRERLTAFRAHYIDKPLPKTKKPCSGRLGDICKPLRQILLLIKPEFDPQFITYLEEKLKERAEDYVDNFAAEILRTIWSKRSSAINGKISIKVITNYYNLLKKGTERKSDKSIGRKITSMGIPRTTMNDGTRGIEFNEEQIKKLFTYYGIEEDLYKYTEVEYDEKRKITRKSIYL